MGIDPTAADLRHEIEEARGALIRTSKDKPDHWWSPRELKAESKNGWSYGAANLALIALIEDGTFTVDKDKIRLND